MYVLRYCYCSVGSLYYILQLCVGDELPDKVCTECVHQVNVSYNFRLQCEMSDVTLRQMLLRPGVRYYIKSIPCDDIYYYFKMD